MSKKLIIVDISSFIFRAFFAIRPMHSSDGTPVNAVYGVLSMLMKLLSVYNPTHIILARDTKGGSFRNEKYELYKANRGEPPEELVPQFAIIEELIQKMKIPHLAFERYEADDIIGSVAVQFKNDFDEILIASGDKDLMQFVDEKVKMLDTMKDITYGRKEVFEKMGVYPEQIMDYLSLIGDSSDNIPGVKGIGPKGAAKLIEEYKNLDSIIENIPNISNKRAKTSLENHLDDAYLSRELVKIVIDLPLGMQADDLAYKLEPHEDLIALLDHYQFRSLKSKILNADPSVMVADDKSGRIDYEVIRNADKWQETLLSLKDFDQISFEAFYHGDDYIMTSPKMVALSTPDKNFIIYINDEIHFEKLCSDLNDIKALLLVSSELKPFFVSLYKQKKEIACDYFDLSQAHFVLSPDQKHDLDTIVTSVGQSSVMTLKEIQKETMEQEASIKNVEQAMANRGRVCLYAYPWLMKKLEEEKLVAPFQSIDQKVLPILCGMEAEGVLLDTDYYLQLEEKFNTELEQIQKEIDEHGGEGINIKSPKQVSTLLFETLGLPIIKKTKTGASTDSEVLSKLEAMGGSEVPGLILKYRELDKLLSTYVRSLPRLVQEDGKLHTHFVLKNAATGRLSSENPNLQNIPIRTENGRRLREGFIAESGYVLLGADYSQVELRILAHLSQDIVMLKAFKNDEDIHAQTAAEVFGVAVNQVTKEQRGNAKAINFGLMYGQSSFGLSQTLNISQKEAKEYITMYFTRFHKVKAYLDSLKEFCEEHGYSETILGRKRLIPDINSTNRQIKSMAERMAINSPIQGTAADIIKLAMIKIDKMMQEQKMQSKMLLQVHDELIFHVPENEIDQMKKLVREGMENAVDLSVPLKVDMGFATNWYDLK